MSHYEDPDVVATYLDRDVELRPAERRAFDRWVPAPCTVVDVGCGTGRTTRALRALGHRVVPSDVIEAMARAAQATDAGQQYSTMDARALALRDGCADVALFSWNGLDFIPDDRGRARAMAELARVVAPQGIVVVSIHSLPGHLHPMVAGRGPVDAVRRLRWFLLAQRGNPGFRHGMIDHLTLEGRIRVRMQTVGGFLRVVGRHVPELALLELLVDDPDAGRRDIRWRRGTVYLVFRRRPGARSVSGRAWPRTGRGR